MWSISSRWSPGQGLCFPTVYTAAPLSLVPKSYRAALADPNWRAAMEEEYNALDLVDRPSGSNVVFGKCIFKHKFHVDGSLGRYKARWVLRGFTQRPRIDFDETFNPVVEPATVRTVLSLLCPGSVQFNARREECFSPWDLD